MSKSKKTSILIIVFIFLTLMSISAKSRKNDEKRFQMGFGFTASSASVFNFVQSMNMALNTEYGYEGLLTKDGFKDGKPKYLTGAAKQALITSNMLAAMQIGFQMRFLAHVFFSELDIIAEPMTSVSQGHCDFTAMFDIGIRCPKWIMPYFAVGINGTFAIYPDNINNVDIRKGDSDQYVCWRNPDAQVRYADLEKNLMITLGAHAKVGLDVKFKRFSVGVYCLYLVKDVINDWTEALPNYYKTLSIANDNPDTYGTLYFVASQFRVGASICWYAF